MANILVIGGAGGVGAAVVGKLLARGDRVVATVLNDTEARQLNSEHGESVAIEQVDLGDADQALQSFGRIVAGMDGVDAVVVCAAISASLPVELTPLSLFRKMFEINCIADIAAYQAALPALRRSGGRMIFISSVSGKLGIPCVGAYTASKFALEGVVDVMRREAAGQGVTLSIVEPGGIRTSMIVNQTAEAEKRFASLGAEERARYGHIHKRFTDISMGSLDTADASTPAEVADVVLEALDAAAPEARYPAGDGARQMLAMASGSDKDVDATLASLFA